MFKTAAGPILSLALAVSAGTAMAGEPYLSPLPGEVHSDTEAVYPSVSSHGVVRVTIDFAKILVLDDPATTIVVGNPAIVNASLSDNQTVILTGKTAGATNFMALDERGDEITNVVIEVVAGGPHMITVHQGVARQTYTCASRCDPMLSVGDETDFFSSTASQIDARHDFAGVEP